MAGRIKAEDVALVKERSSIEDVVREHVTLRPAGPGSMKGLCPFHDEKSPSFNVRPGRRCLALLRLRRGRRRHLVRAEGRAPHLHRGDRAARPEDRHGAALRGGRPAARRRGPRAALAADRGPPGGAGVLPPRPAQRARGPRRPRLPARARVRQRGGQEVRRRVRPARRRGAVAAPAGQGLHRRGGHPRRPVGAGEPRALRPVPRAGWSGRSATSPATPSGSARGGCSTTTGSRPSTSTPPRPRSTRSRPSSTGSTWRRSPSPETARPSSSRATPT